jgi:predicted CopG family antitoxin
VHKKLTITIDERVYDGLYTVVGKGAISQFIEDLVRPHVVKDELDAAYKLMAADKERETEALVWVEALIGMN